MTFKKEDFNEECFNIQALYLQTRDNKYLTELYNLYITFNKKWLTKYCKRKSIFLDIKTIAHDATTRVIERYLKNPDFSIHSRFSGYLYWDIVKILFKDIKHDQTSSYEVLLEEWDKKEKKNGS